jgi:hypothetical protein
MYNFIDKMHYLVFIDIKILQKHINKFFDTYFTFNIFLN